MHFLLFSIQAPYRKNCISKKSVSVHYEKIQPYRRVAWQVPTPYNPLQKRLQKKLREAKG